MLNSAIFAPFYTAANITDELRSRFVEDGPPGYVVMQDATKILGVSRQTVLQRVKRGELDAVLQALLAH